MSRFAPEQPAHATADRRPDHQCCYGRPHPFDGPLGCGFFVSAFRFCFTHDGYLLNHGLRGECRPVRGQPDRRGMYSSVALGADTAAASFLRGQANRLPKLNTRV